MHRSFRALVAAGCLLAIAACGNEPGRGELMGSVQQTLTRLTGIGGAATPSPATGADPALAALSATDQPVIQLFVESRNARGYLLKIETNGAYETWATGDRRSITLRNGFLTATRGIGEDLMSTEDTASQRLVLARQTGQARRIQRYINGDGTSRKTVADCTISKGPMRDFASGQIKTRTLEMVESCRAPGVEFENSYQLDGSGMVLSARQWLSPLNGYVIVSRLRR